MSMSHEREAINVWTGGFLYNPRTRALPLHHRDARAPHNPNKWAMFGGLCLPGETPVRCFVRELGEEVGVRFRPDQLIPLRAHFYEKLDTYRHVFFVTSKMDKRELSLGEGEGFDWIPVGELHRYDITDLTRSDIEHFLANKERPRRCA